MPFALLLLGDAVQSISDEVPEAARDLGAGSLARFRRVIALLTVQGMQASLIIIFIGAAGAFRISDNRRADKCLVHGFAQVLTLLSLCVPRSVLAIFFSTLIFPLGIYSLVLSVLMAHCVLILPYPSRMMTVAFGQV